MRRGSLEAPHLLWSSSLSFPPCAVPIFDDSNAPGAKGKYYLVTGFNVARAGAYSSWHTAHAQCTGVSGATIKGYTRNEWPHLEAAWTASCQRGEHSHDPPVAAPSTPMRAAPPSTPSRSAATWVAIPAPAMPVPLPDDSDDSDSTGELVETIFIDSQSPSPTPAGAGIGGFAYAVRCAGEGEVFDEYGPACNHYHHLHLQHLGFHPVLTVRCSLTATVTFIEEGSGHTTPYPTECAQWIREELRVLVLPTAPLGSWDSESELTESDGANTD
ncbi:hypothetical protein K438DRAFT_1760095 [Mycena galopus ATCC 62051]|nr:hypothetical protein K438DRAFT_1760095 [Mycena galopus ATCC 62051]